ncbi:hypothetical protein HDZ31DRAFT_60291 [Schizophyllum fasciatum]
MAVPASFSVLDISGKFMLNKGLSGDTDKVLQLQGISWVKRKIISAGTIYVTIKHWKDEHGVERIDATQTLSGLNEQKEERTLDWSERKKDDSLFGPVVGKSRRVAPADLGIDCPHLIEGWTADTLEHGLIESYVDTAPEAGTAWTAVQTWGVEEIGGERRYVRHVRLTTPKGDDVQIKLVYDYTGPV